MSEDNNRYLILDAEQYPLALATMMDSPEAQRFRVRIPADRLETVMEHPTVQLVGLSEQAGMLVGRVLDSKGDDIVVLERIQSLGEDMRQNLRMPMRFSTFLYPISGDWKGRREAESVDLSCGGIAFTCGEELLPQERFEMVIPVTSQPLVVLCQNLRSKPGEGGRTLYAAKFVDLCREEESMIREAVFSAQLSSRPKSN